MIPFFQYQAKAIPQQAKFLAEKPYVATALASLMGTKQDEPVYPYMEGKTNISIGRGEDGNSQYITGLGLPYESLGQIPNPSDDLRTFGRDIARDVVGSSQPLLKSAFGAISGRDPYFNSDFGSYGKAPIVGEAGAAGRAYNLLAGAGAIQPLDSPLRMISGALDDRKSAGVRALDLLTGANVADVDPNRALQQLLQEKLENTPSVHKHLTLFQTDKDPDTQALLKQMAEARKSVREHRKAASSAAP